MTKTEKQLRAETLRQFASKKLSTKNFNIETASFYAECIRISDVFLSKTDDEPMPSDALLEAVCRRIFGEEKL